MDWMKYHHIPKTNIVQLKNGEISEILIDPIKLNIDANKFEDLLGDDAKFNANKMLDIFKGKDNDFSKAVCLKCCSRSYCFRKTYNLY